MSAAAASVHHANRVSGNLVHAPPRWWAFVRRGRVYCPRGHRIENTFRLNDDSSGQFRCNKQLAPGQDCDASLFLYAIRGGGIIVVEIQAGDIAQLEKIATPAEALEYLNIFPAGRLP